MDLPLNRSEHPEDRLPHRLDVLRALRALRRGHQFIVVDNSAWGLILEGVPFAASLFSYFLSHEWLKPLNLNQGLPGVAYFGLSDRGRQFLEKGESWWSSLGLMEKLKVNLLG